MAHIRKLISGKALILLTFVAFIALGLPDGLLGVAWPSLRNDFSISLDSMGMIMVTATAGYLTASFLNGKVVSRFGVGKLLAGSCALTGLTLIGYSISPAWWLMVCLGFFAGMGAGAIDAGLNTYVAANYNEGFMQWLHASYGIGITFSPLIMSFAVNSLQSWRLGYAIVGGFQLFLALCFVISLPLWKTEKKKDGEQEVRKLTDYKTSYWETFKQPMVWMGFLLYVIYCAAEVSLGAWAYTLLTESRHVAPTVAGMLTGSYWAFFTVGRFSAGLYTRKISLHTLIYSSILAAMLGTALFWWNPSEIVSLIGIGLTGLAIAPIFPGLMSGTTERVQPKFAANAIGMQMSAAAIGSSFGPAIVGILARNTSLEIIPVSLFVLFVSLLGVYTYTVIAVRQSKNTVVPELESAKTD